MRVRFVSSGLGTGGAEFALLRLCKALLVRGVHSSVVSLADSGTVGPLLRDAGFPLLTLELKSLPTLLQARKRFDRFETQHAPDLIQGWMYHGNLAALHFGRSKCPVAWSVRQSLRGNRDKFSTRMVIRASAQLSNRPTAIVYNSFTAKAQHEARGFSPLAAKVIPNGFDLDEFRFDPATRATVRRSLGVAPNEFVIGHVARFHPSKDHAGFLRAVAQVARGNDGLRVMLAGAGVDSDNRALTRLLARLGLENRVLLLGPRSDVAALMSGFDLFCSSSNGMEGFPNVIAEAMSCEVPCVATDIGDARTVIGTAGEVVQPGDRAALAASLERMVRLPAATRRALGAAAQGQIATRYSIQAIAEQYVRLYESLLVSAKASSCAG